jgi:Ni/Co efflux regulator RcnB
MHKLLLIAAAFGVTAVPAIAQTAQAAATADNQPQAASTDKAKTVKKVVCRDVDEERSIGSRLAATTKICRTVEVPAPVNGQHGTQAPPQQAGGR